jgi:amidophosphoribosyltransferase
MCGVIGIFGHADVARELAHGLTALQHRGQDAAGLVTFDRTFRMKKGAGLVSSVFDEAGLSSLSGEAGLGHVRYSTIGSTDVLDAQPIVANYPFGLAMVHNGNVTNFQELRSWLYEEHHRLLETSNDVALILYTFASQLERRDLKRLSVDDIFESVTATQEKVAGAYSAIAVIANRGFLAFTDPWGIRPLAMGRRYTDRGMVFAFASETTCFDYLGFEPMGDLECGEAVFIDEARRIHRKVCRRERQAFCVFEYIYFAKEDSVIQGRLVATERVRMGRTLARTFAGTGLTPDIVIDVPSSAYFFASGLAEELGIPYRRGLSKNTHVGRSFISPTQEQREQVVRQKLNPIKDVVRGKRVAVVDDSIVRGTTSKHLVGLLRAAGAQEVYFVSASPPIRFPCIYGIDMSIRREIIAAHYDAEEISRYIGADAVVYQDLRDLQALYRDFPICDACFSGRYPTGATDRVLAQIEQERECAKRR